jgi:hypothetical protein
MGPPVFQGHDYEVGPVVNDGSVSDRAERPGSLHALHVDQFGAKKYIHANESVTSNV